MKINLKTPEEIAKEANKFEGLHSQETLISLFEFISERFKALFLKIKL